MMKPADLITYCGGYCGLCARWNENAILIRLADVMSELVDSHGYHHWMPFEVKEFDYNEFRKALDFFKKEDSWLVCWKSCRGGDGRPDCEIRNCCRDHDLRLCFDCKEFPCPKVKENAKMIEQASEYRKLGKEEWLRRQIEKAEQKFEAHTEKYYQVYANKHPPA